MPSKLTPFESSVCAWILRLTPEWAEIDLHRLSSSFEQAFRRGIRGGYFEAKFQVTLRIAGRADRLTLWRVIGDYSSTLEEQFKDYVKGQGHGEGFGVICGDYVAARLTSEGELAKRDFSGDHEFEKPKGVTRGLPTELLAIITGGPDGTDGNVAPGQARLITESPNQSSASAPQETTNPGSPSIASLAPELRDIAAAIRETGATRPATVQSQPPEAEAPASDSPSTPNVDKWLSPGEQAELLLGPGEDHSRDKTRRLQITGTVRKKALASGFLHQTDLDEPRGRNGGTHVKKAAWALPVAYFQAIRAAAGTDEIAKNAFPAAPASSGKTWFFCLDCIKTFPGEADSSPCPTCKRISRHKFIRRNA
ncbi:MAG: hypothetical protein SH850_28675 [Planctomycetaceae bacterium]|nr:hypothetical protein [Planctomycetaceae bacterium]